MLPKSYEIKQELASGVPLYMTPMEIRYQFNVPMSELVLGVAYDKRRGWIPETIPIAPSSSLALVTQGDEYRNGAAVVTLLRSAMVTHREQCDVFCFGEMPKYVKADRNFAGYLFPGADFNRLEDFFSGIDRAIESNRLPVLFMDRMNRMKLKYGPSDFDRDVSVVGAFDSFMQYRKEQIMMIGSMGFFEQEKGVDELLQHFRRILWQVSDDPVASRFGLAYNNAESQFVQAAANKWVQAYQTYVTKNLSSVDWMAGLQIDESDIEFDD